MMEELCQSTMNGRGGSIAPVNIQATDFRLKYHMIQQVQNSCQFYGLPDDANKHLDKFLHVTQSMKQNAVFDDAFRLYLFPYSLTHHATAWFDRFSKNSIHSFEQMVSKFLSKYFPPSIITKLRNKISNFRQLLDESLFEAWECYKLSIDRSHRGESSTTSSSFEIAALAHQMVKMQKDMLQTFLQYQQVNSVTPNCETCGGPHSYYECQATGGYTQDAYATTRTYNPQEIKKVLFQRPQGALPSNTQPNPRAGIKAITTQSGIVLDGPLVPSPLPFSSLKEVERDPKMIMDQVLTKSTIRVPTLVVQSPPAPRSFEIPLSLASFEIPPPHISYSFELPKRNPHQPPIPYPSRLNKEKLQDKTDIQKLRDPMKFLILCDFPKLEKCMALADLGASINLMSLSIWKKLMLLKLVPTCLELANRSIAYLAGIAKDVFVQVGKFTFLADFVLDPHVPLILGRPFLRMARALVDVYGEELILRDEDEKLIFHDPSLDSSLKDNIEKIDSNLEELADEPSLVDLIPSEKYDDLINFKDDDDDLFDLKSDNDEWKKLFTQIFTKVTLDKSLTLEESIILSHSSDHFSDRDLLFFLESTVTETLLSFSSENKGKVFNTGILILKGVHSLTLSTMNGRGGSIAPVNIQATDFRLKYHMIQQVQNSCQFYGLPDDANKHLDKFLHVTQSMKHNAVSDDAFRLYLFPYSLTHHATACWGTFMKRRPKECYDHIENMTTHHNDWDTSAHRGESSTTFSSFEIAALSHQMVKMKKDMLKTIQTLTNEMAEIKKVLFQRPQDGPLVPSPPPFSSSKEVERDPKTIMDQVLTKSTIRVPPLVVQSPLAPRSFEIPLSLASSEIPPPPIYSSFELPKQNPHQPPIPYPSRLNKEKLQDKTDIQVHKFF
nr:hypothetical protein [Tanacetum cinerariifolium]